MILELTSNPSIIRVLFIGFAPDYFFDQVPNMLANNIEIDNLTLGVDYTFIVKTTNNK